MSVRRVPVSIGALAWSDEQLFYGSIVGGRPAILRLTPGRSGPEELLFDAVTPGVTSDGRTVVFVSFTADNVIDLWKADGSGRRIVRLVPSVTATLALVTPDDRSVIYISIINNVASIRMVPLEGGNPTKLADSMSASMSAAVSPKGESLAFTDGRGELLVCSLPGCDTPQAIGPVPLRAPIAWAPDGRGVAYGAEGNVWVRPLSGGSPRQLTRFTDGRPIGSFAWSRNGSRLAITINGGHRHRLAARPEQVSSRAVDDCRTIGAPCFSDAGVLGKERTIPCRIRSKPSRAALQFH